MNLYSLSIVFFSGLFLLLSSGCETAPVNSNDNGIEFCLQEGKLQVKTPEGRPLSLGYFASESELPGIELFNRTPYEIAVPLWRSSCPCIKIAAAPRTIAPDAKATIHLIVQPEHYFGRIVKTLSIPVVWNEKQETVFIPLEFHAVDMPAAPEKIVPEIVYIQYSGDGPHSAAYSTSVAWLFGGKDCMQCERLKKMVFPAVFPAGSKVVTVDLDRPEGLDALLQLEKQLAVSGGDAPVLYRGGRLHYGNEAILSALSAGQ